jgi:hypothetical protein
MLASAALERASTPEGAPSGYATHAAMTAQPHKRLSLDRSLPATAALDDMETMEFSETAPVLHAIAMAAASDEPLDVPRPRRHARAVRRASRGL